MGDRETWLRIKWINKIYFIGLIRNYKNNKNNYDVENNKRMIIKILLFRLKLFNHS